MEKIDSSKSKKSIIRNTEKAVDFHSANFDRISRLSIQYILPLLSTQISRM
jgi:hypothetical protein